MLTYWNTLDRAAVYICNSCDSHMGTRYHCTVCVDLHLCIACYPKEKHPHKMEKRNVNLYDRSLIPTVYKTFIPGVHYGPEDLKARKLLYTQTNDLLIHCVQCVGCSYLYCKDLKRVLNHARLCKYKYEQKCPIYAKFVNFWMCHVDHCTKSKCPLRFCSPFKRVLQQCRLQRFQRSRADGLRLATANTNEQSTSRTSDTQQPTSIINDTQQPTSSSYDLQSTSSPGPTKSST